MVRLTGADIAELAEQLRASRALGQSDGLNRLFDYLVKTSASGGRPKEFDVASAVFGRSSSFDGAQDASVRVAVHRLRRKLDEFYAGAGRSTPVRLAIPKGEYRVVAIEATPEVAAAPARPSPRWIAISVAVLVMLNGLAWTAFWVSHGEQRDLAATRRSTPWAELTRTGMPTLMVVGDYYIFGEIDARRGVDRLVRDYTINSRQDLDAWLMDNPAALGTYHDLDLHYLPVGAAGALRSITPVLANGGAGPENLRVVLASDLTPDMLKRNNIVYVGYLSGLGLLRGPVFAGSRFRIGDTYDELYDTRTRATYISQEGGPSRDGASHRDYGYVAAFRGPQGARIVIVAGVRDTGLMQAAEALASRPALKALSRTTDGSDTFEALYEAQGIQHSGLSGRLVTASPRSARNPWNADAGQRFPAG